MLNESQLQKKMQKAISLKLDGFTDQAVKQFEFILKERPYYLTALLEVGDLYLQTMQYQKAKEVFEKSLQILDEEDDKQQYAYTCINYATALRILGNFDTAGEYYHFAAKLEPFDLLIQVRLGRYLFEVGHVNEALAIFDKVLEIDHRYVDAICSKAEIFLKQRDFTTASNEYKRALLIKPNYYLAIMGLANLYLESKENSLANTVINKGLAIYPEYTALLLNKSILDLRQGNFVDALGAVDKVLRLSPNTMVALKQKAWILTQMHLFVDALRCFDMMLDIVPEDANALFSKSMVQLTLGDFKQGWANHEARLQLDAYKRSKPVMQNKLERWHIESELSNGDLVIVYSEQGLGDTIQFSRYIELLKDKNIPFKLRVQPALKSLMNCVAEIEDLVIDDENLTGNYCVSLMSLPYEFRDDNLFFPKPLKFSFSQEREAVWEEYFTNFMGSRKKIGLVTTGSLFHLNDYHRSVDLQTLSEYLPAHHSYFILQKDLRDEDKVFLEEKLSCLKIEWVGGQFEDFVDTAIFCTFMDEIISVDTSIAHLCGSLKLKTKVLLPFVPDWRWQLNRKDTPWYDNMELMRQSEYGNWKSVFENLAEQLKVE